jgi:hypothetical protein
MLSLYVPLLHSTQAAISVAPTAELYVPVREGEGGTDEENV